MKGKILKIESGNVYVGADDGSVKSVELGQLNFAPNVGDIVEIYESQNEIFILKVNDGQYRTNLNGTAENGSVQININNNNEQKITGQHNGEYREGKNRVNRFVYVLLAIFLGGIGAHKFYAGHFGQGVVYLLFCWTLIPLIIGFFEGIYASTLKADSDNCIYV